MNNFNLIDKLCGNRALSVEEYKKLISEYTPEAAEYAATLARNVREKYYGKTVFIRGLIEISNICKNDCYYCGIRRSNLNCDRYRLTEKQILECCEAGYELGFRTFVMQGGEDAFFSDSVLVSIISNIKKKFPGVAVTLSLGERSKESYKSLKEAGADRYLLRHESATKEHYEKLHPKSLSFENRLECLNNLRELGYQVGCGFMVGSPYQTVQMLAKELKFIENFKPDMCGIGPFIPHKDTDFKDFTHGSPELTCFLLSCIRLIHPTVLLPSTTALSTVSDDGREKGLLAGANVVMPNLSPQNVRAKYMLYNNKRSQGAESAEQLNELNNRIRSIGYEISYCRGDVIKEG